MDLTKFKLPILDNPSGLGGLLSSVFTIILIILGIVAFAYLIYGGAMFLTSSGESEKVTNARNTILYSIVGIVVIALSYLIFAFVVNSLNSGGTPIPGT